MKIYVVPVESKCNASCDFCITNVRKKSGVLCNEEFLNLFDLETSLKDSGLACFEESVFRRITKIEITGGGEPTLHPEIDKVIDICSKTAPTQMYTNGALANKVSNLEDLDYLCISRAHYLNSENQRIMGISYDINELMDRLPFQVKLSLMLCKQGIHTKEQFKDYIYWASKIGAEKVVVREMFNLDYGNNNAEYVPITELFFSLGLKARYEGKNPVVNDFVEFEFPEMTLHADGKMRRGWRDEI